MRIWKAFFVVLALFPAFSTSAADLRLVPADRVTLNPTGGSGYSDFVLHTIGVATAPNEALDIADIRIDVMKAGEALVTKHIPPMLAANGTKGLTSAPQNIFLPYQLLAAGGADEWFGRTVVPAATAALGSNQYLLATRQHFSVDFNPDLVRVTVSGRDADGRKVEVSNEIPVGAAQSPIDYHMPLKGNWVLNSLPAIDSHHRLNPPTEYAIDFFKVDTGGASFKGDGDKAENWYAYGLPVLAAAAGTVVQAVGDVVQDRAAWAHKPGESQQAYYRRIEAMNMTNFARDFPRAAAGNIVVIRHEAGGAVEYSSYGHLKTGSLKVSVGDTVAQGQLIGEVGDTGDSPVVHLHFQVNAGANAFLSKSLSVRFSNLKYTGSSRDPGRFVSSVP